MTPQPKMMNLTLGQVGCPGIFTEPRYDHFMIPSSSKVCLRAALAFSGKLCRATSYADTAAVALCSQCFLAHRVGMGKSSW